MATVYPTLIPAGTHIPVPEIQFQITPGTMLIRAAFCATAVGRGLDDTVFMAGAAGKEKAQKNKGAEDPQVFHAQQDCLDVSDHMLAIYLFSFTQKL
jgi:hypothetical protein